jgi:hypothetical protein
VPLAKRWVFGFLADNGVLDKRIAEVVNYRSNGEDATETFV